MTKRELKHLSKEIETLAAYECHSVINLMLMKCARKLRDMKQEKMLGYAQAVAPFKEQLPLWTPFILSIHDELVRRGLDADTILKDFLVPVQLQF
jgi:hypothetical protein